MQIQKKETLKEDGRFLIYYHFAETATEEETAVFDAIVPLVPTVPLEANDEGNNKPTNSSFPSFASHLSSEGSANV